MNRALTMLALAQWKRGWEEYEWRSQCDGLPKHNFRQPLWDGSPLNGKHILLYTEQGLGDAIQFVRFAPMVVDRGGQVSLICQKELKALLSSIDTRVKITGRDERLPTMFPASCPDAAPRQSTFLHGREPRTDIQIRARANADQAR